MPTRTEFEEQLRSVANEIVELVSIKNQRYGNSALEPSRIFSKADSIQCSSLGCAEMRGDFA